MDTILTEDIKDQIAQFLALQKWEEFVFELSNTDVPYMGCDIYEQNDGRIIASVIVHSGSGRNRAKRFRISPSPVVVNNVTSQTDDKHFSVLQTTDSKFLIYEETRERVLVLLRRWRKLV